jgi:hypothetical protein
LLNKSCKILHILLFLSGSCSETEVSEQLYFNIGGNRQKYKAAASKCQILLFKQPW